MAETPCFVGAGKEVLSVAVWVTEPLQLVVSAIVRI
jgi:hypothetical protein